MITSTIPDILCQAFGPTEEGCVMKGLHFATGIFICLMPVISFAGWEVTRAEAVAPHEPFFQAGTPQTTAFAPAAYSTSAFPSQYARKSPSASLYAVSISGSVKENLERILSRYQWRVVWKAPYDYNFDGRVTGTSLPNVIEKLLQPFPLQAVMYMSNRTVAIVPRVRS